MKPGIRIGHRARRNGLWAAGSIYVGAVPALTYLGSANGNLSIESFSLGLAFTAFFAVGFLVLARRPGHPMGRVFMAIGLLAALGVVSQEYSEFAYLTRPGSLPAPALAAWVTNWYWLPLLSMMLVFPLFLFPTGRPLTPRWRPLVWVSGAATALITVLASVKPTLELQDEDFVIPNPIGLSWVGDVEQNTVGSVLFGALLILAVLAFGSLVIRFRRSRGEERQQLKWFTYGGSLVVVLPLLGDQLPGFFASDVLFGLTISIPPISAGIAILRYRLYDIDRIINRTLVYALVTAGLAAAYAAGVLALQAVLPISDDSPLVVAGTTLAVVALFRPLRERVQRFVDRRFYRNRFDAASTVDEFGRRLRSETDIDSLTSDLLGVVHSTVRPMTASLWLADGPELRRGIA